MSSFPIPSIFWTTIVALAAVLSLATVIGRAWSIALPLRFKATSRFYLAPALGLATLTIVASLLGRYLPLGNSIVVPGLVVALLVWALGREHDKKQVLLHVLMVSIFGMICGLSVLAPLFAYGAFNAHNDAFTYLAHANWLQDHAFRETIAAEMVSPLGTQIALYQQGGFRMGASFLLAFMQALSNLHWSYEVYPAVVISAITVCCLAIGFPLARLLRSMHRSVRLAILAFPAFSLGGLIFGANTGFLPQTLGLSLGAALLFAVGPMMRWISAPATTRLAIGRAALPSAVLFAGATFAYSELALFLILAVIGSGMILAIRFRSYKNLLCYFAVQFGLSVFLLNTELIRAFTALREQSGAVVGAPVEWSLLGFVAHAFGIHGGVWDMFQWTSGSHDTLQFACGLALFGLLIGLGFAGIYSRKRTALNDALLPALIVLLIFSAGTIYFRYAVHSPFSTGQGQSWSQFKLSDWAHPFVMAFLLLALSNFRPRAWKIFNGMVVSLFCLGLMCTSLIGVARVRPVMQYYNDVTDVNRFYLNFREMVLAACNPGRPVYLALGGENIKFREMAALYLPEREIKSDWMDDEYIFPRLPIQQRKQKITGGDCVVEPNDQMGWLTRGATAGQFRAGIFDGRGRILITSVAGAYARESDGRNWWHWVEHKVDFRLKSVLVPTEAKGVTIRFEYTTRGKQILILKIVKLDGSIRKISLPSKGDAPTVFEEIIDLPPTELAEISIETDGKAYALGNGDSRVAAWIIRNLKFTPIAP